MMVRWWRPGLCGEKKFEIDDWIATRFKKLHALPQPNPPHSAGVDVAAWVKDLQKKEGLSRTIWYGYSRTSDVVVELLMTSLTPQEIRKQVIDDILPTLRIVTPDQPMPWSLFSVSFLSPPGFALEEHHLYSGDVALRFLKDNQALVLRMVYPASLALTRRQLANWFTEPPFLERRRKGRFESRDWSASRSALTGIQRTGIKRFPIPLGWFRPRYSTEVAAVDQEHDRLLIADHQTPAKTDPSLVFQTVEDMNWGLGR
jgi:hypothetical protein